jgi:hypothetical protein
MTPTLKDAGGNATCALSCEETTQEVVLSNDVLVEAVQGYAPDCPTGKTVVGNVTIPFAVTAGGQCSSTYGCHLECSNGEFSLEECLTTGPDSYLSSPGYWSFFTLMIFVWSSMAVSVSLSDTICFMVLGEFIYLNRVQL